MQLKGFDLYVSLPLLSVYLGHKHITETEYYLRMLDEHFDGILENPQHTPRIYSQSARRVTVKDNGFSYHLTKYFSDYLPRQTAASVNTIRSYRDTFVQLLSFYKQVYSLTPEKLEYLDFTSKG